MKISKTAVLTLGVMFSAASLGLILVNAGDVDIFVDPSNAIQHIRDVKFVSTGHTSIATMNAQKNGFVKISMDGDFILSKTGDDEINLVLTGSNNSILGGTKNRIIGKYRGSVLLAGSGNIFESVNLPNAYNQGSTIVGGERNTIDGNYGTIVGGRDNYAKMQVFGDSSVIIGGSNNRMDDHQLSVIVGNNNVINSNGSSRKHSVVLGSGFSGIPNKSFIRGDSYDSGNLNLGAAFVVEASSGMVVNENKAHNLAKLTLGGPLSVSDNVDDMLVACGSSQPSSIYLPDGFTYTGGKIYNSSGIVVKYLSGGVWYDASGNQLFVDESNGIGNKGGILKAVTTDTNQICLCSCDGSGWNSMFARGKCTGVCNGDMKPECGDTVERVCTAEGATYSGSCEKGKAVGGEGSYLVDKNNKIHRSCQTDDGSVKSCSGFISDTSTECVWDCEGHWPVNAHPNGREETFVQGSSYVYAAEGTGDCTYSCDSGYNAVKQDGEVRCVKCEAGTYNTGAMACAVIEECGPGLVPYSGGCISLGYCINHGSLFKTGRTEQYYSTGGEWYNSGDFYFRPYGATTRLEWVCKDNSGDVNPHSCEFSCQSGYQCGFWGQPLCEYSDRFRCYGYNGQYAPTAKGRRRVPQFGIMQYHHPTESNVAIGAQSYGSGGALIVEYVDSLQELDEKYNNSTTGCYSFCDTGFHKPEVGTTKYEMGRCISNCKSMVLGVPEKIYNSLWVDAHNSDHVGNKLTGYFYNGKSERTGTLMKWTYVDSGVLDAAIENESGACLWTCRKGSGIINLKNQSEFTRYFTYGSNNYNVCWEACPEDHYFNQYRCVKLSSNQYIPDQEKPITVYGITNYAGQRLACSGDNARYVKVNGSGYCVADFEGRRCGLGYRRSGSACVACSVGYMFANKTGTACIEMCDVSNSQVYNSEHNSCTKDPNSSGGCEDKYTNIGEKCHKCADGYGFSGTNKKCVEYDRCDINKDWVINDGDLEEFNNSCEGPSYNSGCDLDYDGDIDAYDRHYWSNAEGSRGECWRKKMGDMWYGYS